MQKQVGSKSFSKGTARHMMNAAGIFVLCLSTSASIVASTNKSADAAVVKQPTSLQWQQVFATNNAVRFLEFTAHFHDAKGVEHLLHYWREGDKRLRRNTDGNVDLMVERLANGEHRYHVIDHHKKIITQIDQTNLHRIGQFSSWDDFARALTMPASGAKLVKTTNTDISVGDYRCSWYEVIPTPHGKTHETRQHICWSQLLGIPLKVTSERLNGEKITTWLMDSASTLKLNNTAFTVNVEGYASVDANLDISPESD